MKPSQLEEVLYWHGQRRQPIIVLSQPGVGKSAIFRKVFDRLGMPHHTINLALSDGTDLKGLPNFVDHNGSRAVRWVKEHVYLNSRPLALFIDEIFQGQTQVQNSVAPVLLEHRLDDIFLPDGSWVCGASNRTEDKAGTNRVPSHIPNRVTMIQSVDISIDDWADYILNGGSSKREAGKYEEPIPAPKERAWQVVQYLRMKPNALSGFDPNELVNATPRQWEWVAQWIDQMPESLRFPIVAGRVGKGYATELIAFMKVQSKIPSKEEILTNPKKAKVPEEPSALYLVAGMLANASNATTFDSICAYAERIPPEFQAMLVRDAMRIAPEVASTRAFVQWGVKFAEVLR